MDVGREARSPGLKYRTGNPGVLGKGRASREGILSDGIVEQEFLPVFIGQENRARLRIDFFECSAQSGFDQSIEVDRMEQRRADSFDRASCVFS